MLRMKTMVLSVMGLSLALVLVGCSQLGSRIGQSDASTAVPGSTRKKSVLQFAGQDFPAQAQQIITIHRTQVLDPDDSDPKRTKSSNVGWTLLDQNQNGALRGMPGPNANIIEWRVHGVNGFSIVVTNKRDFTVVYGEKSNADASGWRTNAPPPFNIIGVIDAKKYDKNMVVQLQISGNGPPSTKGYWICAPKIDAATSKAKVVPTYYANMVEATLIWNSRDEQ